MAKKALRELLRALVVGAAAAAGLAFAPNATHDMTAVAVHVREWEISVSPDTVPVGTVVFNVANDGAFPHDFAIAGRKTSVLSGGETTALTVTFAQPGRQTYLSTVDDWDREMWGTLTVTGSPAATTNGGAKAALPLRSVADIPLPDGSSRFDYQSLDARSGRLYIAHLGADAVAVFDLRRRRVVGDVHGVPGVHGVLAVPALSRLYATATDARQLVSISAHDLRIAKRTSTGSFPDGLAYDPVGRHVFVSDKTGGAEIVVDRRGSVVRRVPLGGEAGNVTYDEVGRRMLVAVANREQLVSIDPVRLRALARRPLPGCSGAHGLQLDTARRLAFIACEDNARLLVVDLRRGTVTMSAAVGAGPDVLALDPRLHRLYVAAESGVVTVFVERGRMLSELGGSFLAAGAHSVAVDPRTHLVYFPLESVDGKPVLRIMRPRSG